MQPTDTHRSTDRLIVSGIRAYGYTGALPEETTLGQWFDVHLTLWLDLAKAGHSDILSDTHNYADVVQSIQQLIQTRPFKLIEALAETIAAQVLASDARLRQIQVRLTKLTPPIPHFDGQVSVEITRQQSQ